MDCWHHEIDKATSEAEVVRSASDYLVLWTPREITPTTLGLDELRIASCDDIERVRSRLPARASNSPPASKVESHLRELADYFIHASARIGELRRTRASATPVR